MFLRCGLSFLWFVHCASFISTVRTRFSNRARAGSNPAIDRGRPIWRRSVPISIRELFEKLEGVDEVMEDPEITSVRLVTNPEKMKTSDALSVGDRLWIQELNIPERDQAPLARDLFLCDVCATHNRNQRR